MSDLHLHSNHAAWQQRLNKEMNEELKFNHTVDQIRQNRSPEKQNKAIYPFKVMSPISHFKSAKNAVPLILTDKSCTRPSDPNSIMALGATVFSMPNPVRLDEVNEVFTEDMMSQKQNIEKEEINNDDMNADEQLHNENNENEEDNEKKVEFKDDIEVRSKKSINSSRLSEQRRRGMVKALVKRAGSTDPRMKQASEAINRDLFKKMDDQLNLDDVSPVKRVKQLDSQHVKEANMNPILKGSEERKEYQRLSKSKSDRSLISDTKLGNQVKVIKSELEKEKKAKDRAIDILKKVKKGFKIEELY